MKQKLKKIKTAYSRFKRKEPPFEKGLLKGLKKISFQLGKKHGGALARRAIATFENAEKQRSRSLHPISPNEL